MRVESLTTDDVRSWQAYYDRLEHAGPYHDPTYLSTLAGNFEFPNERAECFVLDAGEEFVYYPYIVRPISSRVWEGKLPVDPDAYSDVVASWYYGGPIATPGADQPLIKRFLEAFEDYCRERGIVAEFVRFDPNLANHEQFDSLDPTFNRQTVPIDLTRPLEEIRADYEDRNDRAIRQAEETDLAVEATNDREDVAAFHAIYAEAMEARDANAHYRFDRSFFEELVSTEDLATLLVVRYDGEVVGGFLTVHDDRIAHHFLSASDTDYWDMRVNNLLYHEVVRYAHETGREVFDFQGGRPGVFNFKKGFSPDRGKFHVARRVHLPDVYDDLVEAAGEAGVDVESGYFPAYRVERSN